ncbi:hypothetical protein, conserved [Eimeria necatrix]|uniref:Uncharacterized protein n=1 Tax=Eimeria necatrix TaxID=51315 RepID=U6N114_9EIME|nr:hypothetical protein, conserved [Eimeria necatrix]CDJ67610.1 hypothetical protein, conserved [Eimeria necatrix]
MRPGSTASAVIASWVLSRYWPLAQCSHRSALPVPTQAVQPLNRPNLALIDALRVHCNEVELDGASSCLNALKDDGSVEGTSVSNLEGPLLDSRDNNSLVSMMETRFSPTDESSLVLYHNILRETTNGLVKPSFSYSQTHTSLRSLAVTNIIVGSLLPDLKTRRKFMRRLDKVIEKAAPKSKPQERAELNSVLKVLKHFSGASLKQLRVDHGFMMMTEHLVFSVREGKRIPPLFEQLYNFAKTKVLKGVRAVFKHAQLFRLRNDPHGSTLLKSSFSSRYLAMLTKLWQLDSVGVEALDVTVSQTTFSSEVFSVGFMNGVIDFAKEYSSLVEEDYLPGYEEETTKCYEQDKLLAKTKIICEGAFRRMEVFLARSTEVLNFISWMSLRDHITDLLLMVYNTAKVSLEAQTRQGGHITIETLRAKFGKDSLKQSLAQNILIKPRMQRDVHNITAGVAGIVAFFQLRKLHQWKPRPVDRTRRANGSSSGTASEQTSTEGKPEDLSLVGQRLEAFTDVDMPPELERAAPEFKNANDTTVTSTEATLLEMYSKKRDMLMMSLLRRSVGKLVKAFSSIFGRLQKMFRATVGRGRVHLCRRSDRQPCFNADEATKSRFAVLQFILAAHLGVHVGPNEKLGESLQELKKDFMAFFKDSAWFRYRTRTLKVFQRRTRWGLDILIDYIFPEQKGQGKKGNPISKEALSLIEQAGTAFADYVAIHSTIIYTLSRTSVDSRH